MKKMLIFLLILSLLCGCGAKVEREETVLFTDSLGRTVELPETIDSIAVTGPLSQIYVLPLAEDLLVGVSNAYGANAAKYLPASLFEKQEIGQLYGGKGALDPEALLAAAPDVVIDVGEAKSSMAADLDALEQQTGIPFVHIDATVAAAPEAYRTLGRLLNRQEQGETLASWCENTYADMVALMEAVDADNGRKSLLYCLGNTGTYVLAKGSFHGETLDLMGDNVAVVEEVVAHGGGNESDLEQIMVWDPDVILFAPDSCYDEVGTLPQWQAVPAVAEGRYYETPDGPYGWLSSPPGVQRYLGMLWLGELLYPEYVQYDLQEAVTEYYALFYGCELTGEMYAELMEHAE